MLRISLDRLRLPEMGPIAVGAVAVGRASPIRRFVPRMLHCRGSRAQIFYGGG